MTFKVVNGAWDDEETADKTVTLSGYEDETLKLAADEIPAVGTNPAKGYKAGDWDVTPSTETEITEDTIYTYTYARNIATVTFKVVNGAWNDETKTDKTVKLTGIEGETLKLAADDIPAVGLYPNAGYREGGWTVMPSVETAITGYVTYTYRYIETAAEKTDITITFRVENGSWDDGTNEDITVKLNGYSYEIQQQAVKAIPAVGGKPASGCKAGAWKRVPSAEVMPADQDIYVYAYQVKESVISESEAGNLVIYGLEKSYDYIGKKVIKPHFYVMDESRGVVLSKSTDYTVKYKNNKYVGWATIEVTGKKNYQGKNAKAKFEIVDPLDRAKAEEVKLLPGVKNISKIGGSFVYNGVPQYPGTIDIKMTDKSTVTFTHRGGGVYTCDGDATVLITVGNNVNKGSSAVVAAVGADGKVKTASFKIDPAEISGAIVPENLEAICSVKGSIPDGFTVHWKNGNGEAVELLLGQDYTVTYSKNKAPGTGKITIKGKGNFKGKKEVYFTIAPFKATEIAAVNAYGGLKVKSVKVTVLDPNGFAINPKNLNVQVLDANGVPKDLKSQLQAGEKITVVVTSNNQSVVVIDGDGLRTTMTVGGINFGKVKVDAKPLTVTYTGEPIELTDEQIA